MDGDFALLPELVKLRRKYGFLLVVDDVCILSPLLSYIFFLHIFAATKIMFAIAFSRHMERLFAVRTVVVYLSCLHVKMTLIFVWAP